AISGDSATRAATLAVFGASEHGEDTLLLCVIEPPGLSGVPEWVFIRLGGHIDVPPAVLRAGLSAIRSGTQLQRYKAYDRPTETGPMSWEDAVRNCIDDEKIQRTILESPGPPAPLESRGR